MRLPLLLALVDFLGYTFGRVYSKTTGKAAG